MGPRSGILHSKSSCDTAPSVSSASSALNSAVAASDLVRSACIPALSSHTPVEKNTRSPGGTEASFLAQPLGQSSQKRRRPSSEPACAPSGRCTHHPSVAEATLRLAGELGASLLVAAVGAAEGGLMGSSGLLLTAIPLLQGGESRHSLSCRG